MTNTDDYGVHTRSSMHTVCMCSHLPTHGQSICVVFGHFAFFHTGDRAVMLGLGTGRAVVSFPFLKLLATFLWHAVAAGSLLSEELSYHRWLTISFYLAASLPSSTCSALLLPAPRGMTTFLKDRTHKSECCRAAYKHKSCSNRLSGL